MSRVTCHALKTAVTALRICQCLIQANRICISNAAAYLPVSFQLTGGSLLLLTNRDELLPWLNIKLFVSYSETGQTGKFAVNGYRATLEKRVTRITRFIISFVHGEVS